MPKKEPDYTGQEPRKDDDNHDASPAGGDASPAGGDDEDDDDESDNSENRILEAFSDAEGSPAGDPAVMSFDDIDISDEDWEEALTDKSKFVNILRGVAKNVHEKTLANTEENVLRKIPNVVDSTYRRQATIKDSVKSFYENNKDLEGYKKYLAFKVEEVQSKNPDLAVDKVLEKAGKAVRKELKIDKQAKDTEDERKQKPPRFAGAGGSGGSSSGGSKKTRQQQLMDEILI